LKGKLIMVVKSEYKIPKLPKPISAGASIARHFKQYSIHLLKLLTVLVFFDTAHVDGKISPLSLNDFKSNSDWEWGDINYQRNFTTYKVMIYNKEWGRFIQSYKSPSDENQTDNERIIFDTDDDKIKYNDVRKIHDSSDIEDYGPEYHFYLTTWYDDYDVWNYDFCCGVLSEFRAYLTNSNGKKFWGPVVEIPGLTAWLQPQKEKVVFAFNYDKKDVFSIQNQEVTYEESYNNYYWASQDHTTIDGDNRCSITPFATNGNSDRKKFLILKLERLSKPLF
ncbi:MAG: hypothetical protein AAGA64_15660, partial [Bacteroidota bacterium]